MEPLCRVGIEPTTTCLKGTCSTTELPAPAKIIAVSASELLERLLQVGVQGRRLPVARDHLVERLPPIAAAEGARQGAGGRRGEDQQVRARRDDVVRVEPPVALEPVAL